MADSGSLVLELLLRKTHDDDDDDDNASIFIVQHNLPSRLCLQRPGERLQRDRAKARWETVLDNSTSDGKVMSVKHSPTVFLPLN